MEPSRARDEDLKDDRARNIVGREKDMVSGGLDDFGYLAPERPDKGEKRELWDELGLLGRAFRLFGIFLLS